MTELQNHAGAHFGVTPKGPSETVYTIEFAGDGTQLTRAQESWGSESHPELSPQVRRQIAQYLTLVARRLATGAEPGSDVHALLAVNPNGKRLDPDEFLKRQ